MRKDITKKLLMREDRFLNQMTSKDISNFVFKKSKFKLEKKEIFRLDYDLIEFANMLSVSKEGVTNTQNDVVVSGFRQENYILKNGKYTQFNMIFCGIGGFTMESTTSTIEYPNSRYAFIEKPFLLGQMEVTQELFECVLGYNTSYFNDKNIYFQQNRRIRLGDTSKYPIENVSWYDAVYFCNQLSLLQGLEPYYDIPIDKIEKGSKDYPNNITYMEVSPILGGNGYRLPNEKEWEYASKAGSSNTYAGCNTRKSLSEYAWFGETQHEGTTHPVATKKPNEWGFYDMSGNVEEWCQDANSTRIGSIIADQKITRGGSYETKIAKTNDSNDLSTKIKKAWSTNAHMGTIGFRIARNL